MTEDDNEILGDHRWQRTELIPPLVDAVGESLRPVRWAQDRMPDFLWIALLYREIGGRRAVKTLVSLSENAQQIHSEGKFVLVSDYSELSESEFEELKENLSDDLIDDLYTALEPLIANYSGFPLNPLFAQHPEPTEQQIGYLAEMVDEMSVRDSQLSTHVQGFYIGVLMATGQFKISPESELTDINEVFRYPDTEYSRKLGPIVRASTKAMNASQEEEQNEWVRSFWQRGYELTDCIFPQQSEEKSQSDLEHPNQEFFRDLMEIGMTYEEELRKSILDLWWDAEFDAEFTGKNEVLDGLLLRQVNLTTSLAQTPRMWSQDIGSIILRCLSENYITLEWLNKNGERKHYQDFIEYGLGQEKLFLEHSKAMISDSEEEEVGGLEQGMEDLEDRLEAQKAQYLLPVDVGHWASKNTRELAQEAGIKRLYDTRFQQYSASVHAQWNAIEKENLVICRNPLHQYHRIPEFRPVHKNPFTIVEAGNLMNRSFDSWIEARNIPESNATIPDLSSTVKEFLEDNNTGG